jgi:hypothetical protein
MEVMQKIFSILKPSARQKLYPLDNPYASSAVQAAECQGFKIIIPMNNSVHINLTMIN